MGFFHQRWKKGEDEDGVRGEIDEEYLPPWVDFQDKKFLESGKDSLMRRY